MNSNTSKWISIVLTVLLQGLAAIICLFVELVALNGVIGQKANIAIGVLVLLQIFIMIATVSLAAWATKILVDKYQWNKALAIFVAVLGSSLLGAGLYFLAIIFSILVSGIR